jgi:hypothetical protein
MYFFFCELCINGGYYSWVASVFVFCLWFWFWKGFIVSVVVLCIFLPFVVVVFGLLIVLCWTRCVASYWHSIYACGIVLC